MKSDYRNVLSMAHGEQDLTGREGEVERARMREGWATNRGANSRSKSESHPKVLRAAAE